VQRCLDWRRALGYMTREPKWASTLALGGLFLLVMPPVGWVLALGFRSLVGQRMIAGRSPAVPQWGDFGDVFVRGAKSSGVILGYLSPALVLFLLFGAGDARVALAHARELGAAVIAIIVFPPVSIPGLPLFAYSRWPWFTIAPTPSLFVLTLFLSAILVLPSAFLRVAATGRYAAAFEVITAVRFASANARAYAEAWVLSLTVSAVAVIVVPLMPWLLFWSYLVILDAFLQVLLRSQSADSHLRTAPGAFQP
jgi:Protein of unknown function (DUF4013)